MLKLTDLIEQAGVKLVNFKIHCAIDDKRSGWRPLQQYFEGSFEDGQASQSNENFKCDNVLSLISLGGDRWLFVGVYRVEGVRFDISSSRYIYKLTRRTGTGHLDGRAIVSFAKSFRATYLVGANFYEQLIVSSIREEQLSIADFPGFNRVRLTFNMLASIIKQNNPSWRSALGSVAGVYLVTDTPTGRHYVGSAYGGVGLWQRWTVYVKTGHGGNKELRELLNKQGIDYAQNFQFSLVEICDINSSSEYTVSRESHWKDLLMSRQFGLNRN